LSLLYQPINLSPSNSTIDANQANDFSLTIRGTICVGYQLTIYNNSTGASVYTPAKVDISAAPLYDGDILTISVPAASGGSGMSNGNQYKWSIDLYYDETDHITSREVVFNAYSTPTLSLTVAATLAAQSHEFVPVYTQAENVPIAYFQANLYNSDGVLQRASDIIYSANIRYTFDGFVNSNTYSVDFSATNQAGITVISNKETFSVSYSEPSLNIVPTATNISDSACVQLNWGGAYQNLGSSTGTLEYVDNHIGGKFLYLKDESTAYWSTNVPADFTATFVFAPVAATLDRLYSCDSGDDLLYELDLNTLTDLTGGGVVPPGTTVRGIGGIRNRVYIANLDELKFYEIDPDTLTNLSGVGVAVPGTSPRGMGGTDSQLFHCDDNAGKIYEIDPDTLANVSGAGVTSPGTTPAGIGGTSTRLFHCDWILKRIYELDPNTLANISGVGTDMGDFLPMGIGGVRNKLYCSGQDDHSSGEKLFTCDVISGKAYEIDKDTLANLSGAGVSTPGGSPVSIGGLEDRLYVADNGDIYELDPATLANLSGSGITPSFTPSNIGGTSTNLFSCDYINQKLYELDPSTLANLSGAGVLTTFYPTGIGGTHNRLYSCDGPNIKLFEIDPETLANLSGAGVDAPNDGVRDIGGTYNRLYCATPLIGMAVQTFWELDTDTLMSINYTIAFTDEPSGIGGIKGSGYTPRIHELDPDSMTIINSAVTSLSSPIDIGGAKGWSYTATLPYPIFDLTNSGTSDYLRIVFRTDEINDFFYIQFAGHLVLFKIFDSINVDDGVYFIAITPNYTIINQWIYES
jgi:hypothetical protein